MYFYRERWNWFVSDRWNVLRCFYKQTTVLLSAYLQYYEGYWQRQLGWPRPSHATEFWKEECVHTTERVFDIHIVVKKMIALCEMSWLSCRGMSYWSFSYWQLHQWSQWQWQPTPVFLPGESQGRGSLVGCRLWGHTELDTTEAT